jgi:very-short-patch-repair endonuclease
MPKCPYCDEDFSIVGKHVPYCDEKPDDKTKEQAKIDSIKSRSDVEVNQNKLIQWYHEDEDSLTDISNKTGLSVGLVSNLFDLYGVQKRSVSEGKRKSDKFEKTCKEKYGVTNPSKLDWVKEKKCQTFLENYGVDNIFKHEGFKEWLDEYMIEEYGKRSVPDIHGNGGVDSHDEETKQKLSQKMKEWWKTLSEEKYKRRCKRGKDWWKNLSERQKEKHTEKVFSSQQYESDLEKKFEGEVLSKIDIKYRKQCFISGKAFDFYLPNQNLLIEVNGDYWHANPIVYEPNDIISYPGGEVTAKEIRERDKEKSRLAEEKGFNVIEVWEKDILNDTTSVVEKVKKEL